MLIVLFEGMLVFMDDCYQFVKQHCHLLVFA